MVSSPNVAKPYMAGLKPWIISEALIEPIEHDQSSLSATTDIIAETYSSAVRSGVRNRATL
jgi:hypothetical protein